MPPVSEEPNNQESSVTSQDNYSKDKSEATVTATPQSLTKKEFVNAFCNEVVKKYPSHPFYLDCKKRGY